MKAPTLSHPDKIRRKLLGQEHLYSDAGQAKGIGAYYLFLKTVLEENSMLFMLSAKGKAILTEIKLVKQSIDFGWEETNSLTKVFIRIEAIKTTIEEYIKESCINVRLAIELEIIGGFAGAKTDSEIPFLASAPKQLYQRLTKARTWDEIKVTWNIFKASVNSPLNAYLFSRFKLSPDTHRQITLREKIEEIDALIARTEAPITNLTSLVAVINSIPEHIDKDDAIIHQRKAQAESVGITKSIIEQYCLEDLQGSEDIKPTYLDNGNITLELGYTNSLNHRSVRTITLIAPYNEDIIDNRTTFNQIGFSRITILDTFSDIKALDTQTQVVNQTASTPLQDQPTIETNEPKKTGRDEIISEGKTSFVQRLKAGWRWVNSQFSLARLRKSPVFMMGFALFLGLAHSGKANEQTAPTNTSAPITTVASPVTLTIQSQPSTVDTPAPTVTNSIDHQTVTRRTSTSEGSRYSIGSHNHNTDETLQRMVKAMGFNSVQIRVIATRLDGQLRAARDIQAPGTHTHANQNVVMEELNGQIKLSVQDASGSTLYQTGWFAREIGFRNFQPRA